MIDLRRTSFEIRTSGQGFYALDEPVADWLHAEDVSNGVLTLFIQHTSASLLIQENADPDVPRDLLEFLGRRVPDADSGEMTWLRHTSEGPDDMPAHIKAAFLPSSLSIPVTEGAPMLGRWQGIFLVEHRTAPHLRRVVAHLVA